MVIALRSNCRVHGRTAAPGAVVLVEGLVLLREVGRLGQHGRLKPVVGDSFKPSLLDRLKTLLERFFFLAIPKSCISVLRLLDTIGMGFQNNWYYAIFLD